MCISGKIWQNGPTAVDVRRNNKRKIGFWSGLNEVQGLGVEIGKNCSQVARDVVTIAPLPQGRHSVGEETVVDDVEGQIDVCWY